MKKIIVLMAAVISLSGCSDNVTEQRHDGAISVLYKEIDTLKEKVDALDKAIFSLGALFYTTNTKVTFSPSSKGSQSINTSIGKFIISLEDLKKYANGYKATFLVGNPNFISINNGKIEIEWGKDYADIPPTEKRKVKFLSYNIDKEILPGSWNRFTIVLSPATDKETGYISLKLLPDHFTLLPDNRPG